MIRGNIGYEDLLTTHPYDRNMIDGITALILETVLTKSETIVIASNRYPAAIVKSKFLKLGYRNTSHPVKKPTAWPACARGEMPWSHRWTGRQK